MPEGRSGVEAGEENVRRLRAYLDALALESAPLPDRNGRPNVSAIALACGFDRQVLYKNPIAKALLEAALERSTIIADGSNHDGDKPTPATTDRRDRRIHKLEQENAALRAEVVGLRERLRRLAHVEQHMVETGRRVAPLLPSLGEIGK